MMWVHQVREHCHRAVDSGFGDITHELDEDVVRKDGW